MSKTEIGSNRMDKFAVQINLENIAAARAAYNEANQKFAAEVDTAMSRLLHEAARNFMSVFEVAKHAGLKPSQVKTRMRKVGLNPASGKTLLSKQAAKVLNENAELMGIEPHEIDLMSPLAYLPAGKFLETDQSVKDLDKEPLVHSINFRDDDIACGASQYESPLLVSADTGQINCAPCRVATYGQTDEVGL